MRALSHARGTCARASRRRAGPWPPRYARARISHAPSGPATATPRHRSPSMQRPWVHSVRKSRLHARLAQVGARYARTDSRARSVPRWRSGQSTSLRPALIARRRISSTSGLRSAPSTRTSAPKPRYTPSTSPMASCASSRPMRSGRSPPTSADSDSFPSENAPAPENPVVIRQGSQFAHGAPACFGHTRSSTAKPLSTMTMRPVKPRSKRESAQKIPAGPAPTMTTSVSMVPHKHAPVPAPFRRRDSCSASLYPSCRRLVRDPATGEEQPIGADASHEELRRGTRPARQVPVKDS